MEGNEWIAAEAARAVKMLRDKGGDRCVIVSKRGLKTLILRRSDAIAGLRDGLHDWARVAGFYNEDAVPERIAEDIKAVVTGIA